MTTKIEWVTGTDGRKGNTWNPITGCTKVSPGCLNCYAERMAKRLAGRYGYPDDNPFAITWHEDKLLLPTKWKKPRRIFVCSMSDLFHGEISHNQRGRVFDVMAQATQHTYQILTKRPRMIISWETWMRNSPRDWRRNNLLARNGGRWPSNVWLGVTTENQEGTDVRIPELMEIKAQVRWISAEPLIGPIDLARSFKEIHWVVIGCESGPRRRPCNLDWVRDIIDQCKAARVPVFVKQLDIGGRVSHSPDEWPEWARVREYPNTAICGI